LYRLRNTPGGGSVCLVLDTHPSSEPETATVRLDWQLIDARCVELGATTGAERALLLGAGRAQLYRWRHGTNDIGLARAGGVAARLGLALTDIIQGA
jgi:hypothetical protein